MLLNIPNSSRKLLKTLCHTCRIVSLSRCNTSDCLYNKYTEEERSKILQVINHADLDALSSYDISKVNLKKISKFRSKNGQLNNLNDIEQIEGISERSAKKIFGSILDGSIEDKDISSRIKGQFLYPKLNKSTIEECETVVSVYVTANSVCWTQVKKENYEVTEWQYYGIDYPENKRLHIIDILDTAWRITQKLPKSDIYVMKAEATTVRASGSDPNNPKVLAVNLQKSQMISMLVALITARSNQQLFQEDSDGGNLKQNVYFLRPTLPYRLYGTLVGKEKVSTEQTVEMLLSDLGDKSADNSHAYIPVHLKNMFRSQRDLEKDMLGHCLLLCFTFMDLCVYKNKDRIVKLIKQNE